jgi:5-enolpyruvylshikimate-3-phosphate synthase
MAFSIAGLKIPNMVIKNPENVNKSFPKFYEVLKNLK